MSAADKPRRIIVLGAAGRLGTVLLPHLLNTTAVVTGVGRSQPADHCPGLRWKVLDVTDRRQVDSATCSLAEMSVDCSGMVVVDLLLDRSSVTAMRRSIEAGPHFVDLLSKRLAEHGRKPSLFVASTTAVLAPWALQTPYGLAKRRQLRHYTALGLPGAAMLLPQLKPDTRNTEKTVPISWTFHQAARRIAQIIAHDGARSFTVQAPPESSPPPQRQDRQLFRDARHTLHCWLQRLAEPESPQAHRHASRALLDLIPPVLRQHVDHHGAPAALLHRLDANLDTRVVRTPPI